MKTTINVNIAGLAFILDQDAHEMLSDYLRQVENRLTPSERGEIMEDVENRIADIFSQHLSLRTQVISMAIVRDAINTIGLADEFAESPPQPKAQPNPEKEDTKTGSKYHFRRSQKDKVFGGICGGLAPVIGIDVKSLRLILVVLAILSVSSLFWIYVILWIIIPEEPTTINEHQNERR